MTSTDTLATRPTTSPIDPPDAREMSPLWAEPGPLVDGPDAELVLTVEHARVLTTDPDFVTRWACSLALRYDGDEVDKRPVELAVAGLVLLQLADIDPCERVTDLDSMSEELGRVAATLEYGGYTEDDVLHVEVLGVDPLWRSGGLGPLLVAECERTLAAHIITLCPGYVSATRKGPAMGLEYRERHDGETVPLASMQSWERAGFALLTYDCDEPWCDCDEDGDEHTPQDLGVWGRSPLMASEPITTARRTALLEVAGRADVRAWHRALAVG